MSLWVFPVVLDTAEPFSRLTRSRFCSGRELRRVRRGRNVVVDVSAAIVQTDATLALMISGSP